MQDVIAPVAIDRIIPFTADDGVVPETIARRQADTDCLDHIRRRICGVVIKVRIDRAGCNSDVKPFGSGRECDCQPLQIRCCQFSSSIGRDSNAASVRGQRRACWQTRQGQTGNFGAVLIDQADINVQGRRHGPVIGVADQQIVAAFPFNNVVACPALQRIRPVTTNQVIVRAFITRGNDIGINRQGRAIGHFVHRNWQRHGIGCDGFTRNRMRRRRRHSDGKVIRRMLTSLDCQPFQLIRSQRVAG